MLNGGAGRDVFLTNNAGDRVNGAGGEDSAEPDVLRRLAAGPCTDPGTVTSTPVAAGLEHDAQPGADKPAQKLNAAPEGQGKKKARPRRRS